MKNDLTTGAWQHNIGCPISITLLSASDAITHVVVVRHRPHPPPLLSAVAIRLPSNKMLIVVLCLMGPPQQVICDGINVP
jgi:hypothetical protein